MKNIFILIGFILFQPVTAQEITITGAFEPKDMAAAYVAVLGNIGQKNVLAESKVSDGKFSMSLPQDTPQGVYKLVLGMQDKVYFYWLHTGQNSYELVFKNSQNQWRMECLSSKAHEYLTNYIQQEDSLMQALSVLYFFTTNYPEKKEKLFTEAQTVLEQKIKNYKEFRTNAIAKAPMYCNDVLTQNQVFIYNPLWDNATLEQNYEATFYDNIPVKDSTYYKKPFFGDKLEQFFSPIIEDKIMSEEEKYINIKKRVLLTIKRLENNPQRNKFYNIMVRYFVNVQYPQIIPTIDTFLDINYLLTPEDRKAYLYRMTQKELIHSKSPPILSESNQIIDFVNQEKNYLVFVGNNTPFSTAVLQQLNMATQNKHNAQVTAILFTDNVESIQNFKNLFPSWKVYPQVGKTAEETIKKYSLSYVPTIFELNKDNIILKIVNPFEK